MDSTLMGKPRRAKGWTLDWWRQGWAMHTARPWSTRYWELRPSGLQIHHHSPADLTLEDLRGELRYLLQ